MRIAVCMPESALETKGKVYSEVLLYLKVYIGAEQAQNSGALVKAFQKA